MNLWFYGNIGIYSMC